MFVSMCVACFYGGWCLHVGSSPRGRIQFCWFVSHEADAALDVEGGVFIANNDVCVRNFVGFVKRVHLKRAK